MATVLANAKVILAADISKWLKGMSSFQNNSRNIFRNYRRGIKKAFSGGTTIIQKNISVMKAIMAGFASFILARITGRRHCCGRAGGKWA